MTTHNRKKIELTAHQLTRIKDTSISGRKLELEIGISAELINRKRIELGLQYRTKKLPKKPLDKTESIFDIEHRLRGEGKKIAKDRKQIEAEQIASGTHEWRDKLDRGIWSKVLIKVRK